MTAKRTEQLQALVLKALQQAGTSRNCTAEKQACSTIDSVRLQDARRRRCTDFMALLDRHRNLYLLVSGDKGPALVPKRFFRKHNDAPDCMTSV